MASGSGLPNMGFLRALDSRAARIANPTKRLQFLRRELVAHAAGRPKSILRKRLLWAACALMAAVAMDLYWRPVTLRAASKSASFQAADPEAVAPPGVWLIET